MNKPILLTLFAIACIITCCRADPMRLKEKHKRYSARDHPGGRLQKYPLTLVSGMGGKTHDLYVHRSDKCGGGLTLTQYGEPEYYIKNDTGHRMSNTGGYPFFTIKSWVTSPDGKAKARFSNVTIGKNTFPYSAFKRGPEKLIMSIRGDKDSAEFAGLFNQDQQVTMRDTTTKLIFSTPVYAPAILNVTSPQEYDETGMMHVDLKNGLTLYWNADTNNTGGILIEIEDISYGSLGPECFFTLPDNGTFTIPTKYLAYFLKGKPDWRKFASMWIKISRGDVQTVKGSDGRSYKTMISTQFESHFVLR